MEHLRDPSLRTMGGDGTGVPLEPEPVGLNLGTDAGFHVFRETIEVLLVLPQNPSGFLEERRSGDGVEEGAKGIHFVFDGTA